MRVLCCWSVLGTLVATANAQASLAVLTAQLGGPNQSLQGQQQVLSPFTLTVLTNTTHALIHLNMTRSPNEVGWAAIGFGTQMSSADMVIAWPNKDASWTISHRLANGHVMPQAVEPPPATQDLGIVPELTSTSLAASSASFAFLRALSPSSTYSGRSTVLSRAAGQPLIYAYSSSNPGSSSYTATLAQHDQGSYGSTEMDLSQPVSGSGISESLNSANGPWTRYDSIVVLHALCGGLAWVLISPMAVLVARLGRDVQGWLRMHQLLQTVLTLGLTVAAVALGAVATNVAGDGHANDAHKALGLIMLGLLAGQLALGFWIHRLFSVNRTKRPIRNVTHILLGITLIYMGYAQVYRGFTEYDRSTPTYIVAIVTISLVLFTVGFTLSALRVVQHRRGMGMSWSRCLFGLGRNAPIALDEKHLLDPFGRQPPSMEVTSEPLRIVDLSTHEKSDTAAGAFPITERSATRVSRPEWISFESRLDVTGPGREDPQRISRPHYAAQG